MKRSKAKLPIRCETAMISSVNINAGEDTRDFAKLSTDFRGKRMRSLLINKLFKLGIIVLVILSGHFSLFAYDFSDSHFHITNYVQEGTNIHDFVNMLGNTIERSTLFGIPLQQQWSFGNTGDFAPTYYLQTDAPLYYYSFTDAQIAMAYKSLTPEQQARLDPMITGFNPADMYAADHIRLRMSTGIRYILFLQIISMKHFALKKSLISILESLQNFDRVI